MKQIIILLIFFSTGVHLPMFACDCGKTIHKIEYANTDVIITGKVLSIENDPESCYNGFCNSVFIKIQVFDTYKGIKMDTLTLHTSNYPSGCSFPFELDETYLLYLNNNYSNIYTTSLCTRTTNHEESIRNLIIELKQIKKEIRTEKLPKIEKIEVK